MNKTVMMAALAMSLVVAGCRPRSDPAAGFELAGSWLLRLPAGFEHSVTLTRLGPARFEMIKPGLNLAGVYEVRGDQLEIVTPRQPRYAGFVWHIEDANHLTLTGQPPPDQTGGNYLGATLVRAE